MLIFCKNLRTCLRSYFLRLCSLALRSSKLLTHFQTVNITTSPKQQGLPLRNGSSLSVNNAFMNCKQGSLLVPTSPRLNSPPAAAERRRCVSCPVPGHLVRKTSSLQMMADLWITGRWGAFIKLRKKKAYDKVFTVPCSLSSTTQKRSGKYQLCFSFLSLRKWLWRKVERRREGSSRCCFSRSGIPDMVSPSWSTYRHDNPFFPLCRRFSESRTAPADG